jgi:hypothetical protein
MRIDSRQLAVGSPSENKRWISWVKNGVFSLFIVHCSLFIACTPDPDPVLNYKDRQFVDSLFRLAIDTLKDEYDSLCLVRYDSAVQFNVDSMMKVRKSEIEKYLERIRQSQQ